MVGKVNHHPILHNPDFGWVDYEQVGNKNTFPQSVKNQKCSRKTEGHFSIQPFDCHKDEQYYKRTTMREPFKIYNYFLMICYLSIPFYVIGFWGSALFPVDLPISALMVVCPALALWGYHSYSKLKEIILKSLAFTTGKMAGYVLAFLTMPIALTFTFLVMSHVGIELPPFQVSLWDIMILVPLFFVGSFLEEIGWTGYATKSLLRKKGVLYTGVSIGVLWGVWHIIPYLQMGKDPSWIFWQCFGSVLKRIVMVWIYAKYGRNLFMIVVFHAFINISVFVFPSMGSHYDPYYFSLVFLVMMGLGLIYVYLSNWKRSIQGKDFPKKTF